MRSDHWNFLANLLGTPGPAEPPKKSAPKTEAKKPEAKTPEAAKPVAESPKPAMKESPFSESANSDSKHADSSKAKPVREIEEAKPDELDDVFAHFTRKPKPSQEATRRPTKADEPNESKTLEASPSGSRGEPSRGSRSREDSPSSSERSTSSERPTSSARSAAKPSAFEDAVDDGRGSRRSPEVRDDVLDALTAVQPPAVLPGFGTPTRSAGASSYDPAPVAKPDPTALDRAIRSGNEASESGARGDRTPRQDRSARDQPSGRGERSSRDERTSRDERGASSSADGRKSGDDSARRDSRDDARGGSRPKSDSRSSGGFGSGLVNDFDDQEDLEVRDLAGATTPTKDAATKNKDDDGEGRPANRRRGRRGSRQRTSAEDVAQLDNDGARNNSPPRPAFA